MSRLTRIIIVATSPLLPALMGIGLFVGCPSAALEDKSTDMDPDIMIADTEITEGEALMVEGCVEHGLGTGDSGWEIELLEEVDGTDVLITAVLSWTHDPSVTDDDGTSEVSSMLSIHGLAAGTYTVHSDAGPDAYCYESSDNTFEVTVLPAI